MIDPALLRPGRLDTLLYVPLPDPPGRASILRTLVRNTPLAADVDVSAIGESNQCEGFSGADLHSLVRIPFNEKTVGSEVAEVGFLSSLSSSWLIFSSFC